MIKINSKKKEYKKLDLAPITLFTFNRLEHLEKTINSLKKNNLAIHSELIIFSDYAKKRKDKIKIQEIRIYLKKISGFRKIKIYERKVNFGLSKNIITGLNKVFKKYERTIILEDDILVDKFFLKYMNEGLSLYKSDKRIASIHGYIYPIKFDKSIKEYFFLKGADCWGWGTWKRAWKAFDKNGKKLINEIDQKNLKYEFNFNNTYDYYQMLKKQIDGKNNSWAIRWYASAFLKNMLTLYPSKTFVRNIGIDGSGTHGKGNYNLNSKKFSRKKYFEITKSNITIEENMKAKNKIAIYFKKNEDFWLKKILKKIF